MSNKKEPTFKNHWQAIMHAMDNSRMKCKFCGKEYSLWCWARYHLENKHPLEFSRLLSVESDGFTSDLRERLIRNTLKIVK